MLETVIADVNAAEIPIVSVDLPSGMSADTPHLVGDCIDASLTVTLAAPKLPLVLPPGEAYAGDVVIADIGIPHEVIDALEGPHVELLTPEQLRGLWRRARPIRTRATSAALTIAAGSTGKTGAAYLAAMGALRSGAGLVTVATPASCLPVIASMGPAFMTLDLAETMAAWSRRLRSIGCWSRRTTWWPAGRASVDRRTSPSSCGRCSIGRRARSCSTPTRSPCWPTIPGD